MPLTLIASPTIVRDARKYAAASGTTLEALVIAYITAVAKRVHSRCIRTKRPAFFDITHRISDEGAEELLSVQREFENVEEDLWK